MMKIWTKKKTWCEEDRHQVLLDGQGFDPGLLQAPEEISNISKFILFLQSQSILKHHPDRCYYLVTNLPEHDLVDLFRSHPSAGEELLQHPRGKLCQKIRKDCEDSLRCDLGENQGCATNKTD